MRPCTCPYLDLRGDLGDGVATIDCLINPGPRRPHPDITVYSLFQWYDYVYYHSPDASFPFQKREMGRLIGVADNCTDKLAFVILPLSRKLLIRKSVWGVPPGNR